jgi:hypothetical protein
MRYRVAATFLILAALLFSAVGCGGDDEPTEGAPATTAETTTVAEDGNVRVGGRVILDAERGGTSPLGEMTVLMVSQDGERFTAVSEPSGHFALDVPPGDYEVSVSGFAPQQVFIPIQVSVPEGEPTFQLPPLTVTD